MGQIYQINQVKVPYGATGEQLKKARQSRRDWTGAFFLLFES